MSISAVGSGYSYQTTYNQTRRTEGQGEGPIDPMTLDTDGDGALSLAESGLEEEIFTQMDTDGDGYLTEADRPERPDGPPPGASIGQSASSTESEDEEEEYDDLDTNQDGVVSLEELQAGQAELIAILNKLGMSDLAGLFQSKFSSNAYGSQDSSGLSLSNQYAVSQAGALNATA